MLPSLPVSRTVDDFLAKLGAFLAAEWMVRSTWDRETLAGFIEHGIPVEWARLLDRTTKGAIPVEWWPKLIHPPKALHTRSQRARVNDVDNAAKLNMSRSSSDDPFTKACRAKDLTQNGLADKLGIPASLLSMYRRGVRRIPQARAERIEALTGWKATAKNWPGGIVAAD